MSRKKKVKRGSAAGMVQSQEKLHWTPELASNSMGSLTKGQLGPPLTKTQHRDIHTSRRSTTNKPARPLNMEPRYEAPLNASYIQKCRNQCASQS